MPLRIGLSVLAIGSCLFVTETAARVGFARLLAKYAVLASSIPAADEALRLANSDPEVHRARAAVLNRLRMPADARKELEIAASLRYRDDYLWLELGNTREELEDSEGALAAFDQAVRWAPYYAHPRWQRGNLRLRMGRRDEAFAELRDAAGSNRNLLPSLIDLAWGLSGGDAKKTEQLVQINDNKARLVFARFLAKKGKGKDAVEQLRLLTAPLSAENRNDLIRQLLGSNSFREAFEVWNGFDSASTSKEPAIYDGGFEEPLAFDDAGFRWVVSREQSKARLAIDVSEWLGGTKSLQIAFDGNSDPNTPLLSQTIIVKPQQRYRISLGVRAKDLVTGASPLITVSDAMNDQLLGKSDNFVQSTSPWRTMDFEFTTLPTSEAIVLRLRRNSCTSSPCPIFGVLWLDEFFIEELKPPPLRP